MKFSYKLPATEEETKPGRMHVTNEGVKYDDATAQDVVRELTELERSGYDVTVNASVKLPKE